MAAQIGRGLALLVAALLPSAALAQSQPFPHRKHLEDGFRGDPGNAACTTKCHTFDRAGLDGYLAPYDSCAECHQPLPAERAGIRISGAKAELARPKVDAAFLHQSPAHQALRCLDCHAAVESGSAGLEFAIPNDLALCRKCHSDHDDKLPKNQSLQDQLLKTGPNACAICHLTGASDAARTRNDRQFLHRDHLKHNDFTTGAWTKDTCDNCHKKVASAPAIRPDNYASLFLGPSDAGASCGKCHRDRPLKLDAKGSFDFDGAVAGLTWEKKTRGEVLTTFRHDDHFKSEKLKECKSCHPPSPSGEPQTDATYVTCVGCHTDRQVENHPTGVCLRCHQNAAPKSDADAAIATVTVTRESAAGFILQSHAHPGVTLAGAPLADEKCSDCHLGRPAALLRPKPRPFDHSSHLAEKPTSAKCRECHENVVATADNAFVRCWDQPPPGQAASCDQCHKGSDFTSKRELAHPEVPLFSHRSHLASSKRKLECADCHVADPADPTRIAAPTTAICKQCHGHVDPQKVEVTGGKLVATLRDRCEKCHGAAPDETWSKFKFDVTRESGQLEPGHQWHDQTGGCQSCHGLGKLGAVVPKLAALVVKNPHTDPDPPLPSIRNERFNKNDHECGRCHTQSFLAAQRSKYGGAR